MQIEFIGCTSAGKTSLIRRILQDTHLANGFDLVSSYDFVLQSVHLDWVRQPTLRTVSLHLIAFGGCLLTWQKNLDFYRFAAGVIRRLPRQVGFLERLKIARIVARNVGVYEIVRRFSPSHLLVLADEGTLHIANYLFVHVSTEPDPQDIETFLQLVSLPDTAVYVRQPASILIQRTSARKHKRIPQDGPASVERFIQHSLDVFERLAASARLQSRLLEVNGSEPFEMSPDNADNHPLRFAQEIMGPAIGQNIVQSRK